MIKIEKIEAKGVAFQVVLNEDGLKTTLVVHQEVLMHHRLFQKKTLTQKERQQLEKESATALLMQKALDLLARKDRSVASMRKKLSNHGDKEAVEDTLQALKANGYLDDDKVLRALIDDMMAYSLKGPRAIRAKAIKEGFPPSAVDSALSEFTEAEEAKRVEQFVHKHIDQYPKDAAKKKTMKLIRLAVQNGYDMELAKESVNRHMTASKDDAEEDRLLGKRIVALKDKYDLDDYKSRSKLIQKLMRDGFDYEAIKDRLK